MIACTADWNRNGVKMPLMSAPPDALSHREKKDDDRLQHKGQDARHGGLALHGEAAGLQRGEKEAGEDRACGLAA